MAGYPGAVGGYADWAEGLQVGKAALREAIDQVCGADSADYS